VPEAKKMLRINKCDDPLMWYSDKVGEYVPYISTEEEIYWSREDAGFRNAVKREDADVCLLID